MKSFNEFSEGLKQARKNVGADKCWDGYKAKGTKKKDGKEVPNCVKEGKKKGLWDNIHAKRKRGEKPAKPGDKDYPKTLDIEEDWQKENRKDKTDGLSQKAVNAYRRENPGSKLQTAVTTKPSKLDPDSKDAKRRKNFCSRSRSWTGEKGKAARKRWNCN